MNPLSASTVFSVIFAIYFAGTVMASQRFQPFDTAAIVRGDLRALARLALAFIFLNVFPFWYFYGAPTVSAHCPRPSARRI